MPTTESTLTNMPVEKLTEAKLSGEDQKKSWWKLW